MFRSVYTLCAAVVVAAIAACKPFPKAANEYPAGHVVHEAAKGYLSISGACGLISWMGSAFVVEVNGVSMGLGNGLTAAHNLWYMCGDIGEVMAETHTGAKFKVNAVGYEKETDIGVIYSPSYPGMKPLSLGNSDDLKLGQMLYGLCTTVWNPSVIPYGPLIAKDITDYYTDLEVTLTGLMTFDGARHPQGCSGGPVLTEDGKVVGVMSGIPTITVTNFEAGRGAVSTYEEQRGREIYFVPINTALEAMRRIVAKNGH
ncbi:MAG: serine protease [Parcubacteria group bacterium]|nr:serine protease [Parcubacteria group bacterium]